MRPMNEIPPMVTKTNLTEETMPIDFDTMEKDLVEIFQARSKYAKTDGYNSEYAEQAMACTDIVRTIIALRQERRDSEKAETEQQRTTRRQIKKSN